MDEVVVADLGGTHARVARARDGRLGEVRVCRPEDGQDLVGLLRAFLAPAPRPEALALAVAGPVHDGIARWTHRGWTVDARALAAALGCEVRLLNDLEAAAHGLATLAPGDTHLLHPGVSTADPRPRLVIAPGTGLGAALWVPGADGGTVVATEPGHVRLARPAGVHGARAARTGRSDLEGVVSGPGLARLARAVAQEIGRPAGTPTPEAVLAAARDGEDAATAAVHTFVVLLAGACRDLALATGAVGGVVLTGGLARALEPWLVTPTFARTFVDVPTLPDHAARIPVHLVLRPHLALHGLLASLRRPGGAW
ncbi:MAG: ROK family protein [Alphaproteobacteria bacterium]|nr:ROK family protein [Alphaproteobacteria bacterium]